VTLERVRVNVDSLFARVGCLSDKRIFKQESCETNSPSFGASIIQVVLVVLSNVVGHLRGALKPYLVKMDCSRKEGSVT